MRLVSDGGYPPALTLHDGAGGLYPPSSFCFSGAFAPGVSPALDGGEVPSGCSLHGVGPWIPPGLLKIEECVSNGTAGGSHNG